MSARRGAFPAVISILTLSVGLPVVTTGAQKLKPEELVKRHLEQTFPAAAAAPSRIAGGTCEVSSMMGSGTVSGPFELKSNKVTSRFDLRFGIPTYEGEAIVFDGEGVDVGFAQRRTNTRSVLGSFLSTYSVIVGDGLFGGVLNQRWPLRDLQARDTKLSYDGMKKLDGRSLHRVKYRVDRSQGDLSVQLYFEPETFRHVASVYEASRAQESSLSPTSMQDDERFTVSETFSEFQTTPAGAVPGGWFVRYTRSGGRSVEWRYDCKVQSVTNGS